MARKDTKGRNLRTGESQRPDGRYMYRYKDILSGKRVTIYDMNLAALREREKEIHRNMDALMSDIWKPKALKTTPRKNIGDNGIIEYAIHWEIFQW